MILFPSSHLKRYGLTAILVVLVLGVSTSAPAEMLDDDPDDNHSIGPTKTAFNGSFTEWSLRGGLLLSSSQGSPGATGEIGLRSSFPFYLGDHRLAYNYGRWSVDNQPIQMHGLHATVGIHPFYLALLSQGLISHFLASLHLELGIGPRLALVPVGDEQGPASRFGVAASLGVGFDLPITDPNQGRSLWINTNYRRSWTSIRYDANGNGDAERLHEHGFFLGLSWRSNGLIW